MSDSAGGFLVPGWMGDYLIALHRYEQGLGPKPELPQELRRTHWEHIRMQIAGRFYAVGHGLSDGLSGCLQDHSPSVLAGSDWHGYVGSWVARPLFWLGHWIDIEY